MRIGNRARRLGPATVIGLAVGVSLLVFLRPAGAYAASTIASETVIKPSARWQIVATAIADSPGGAWLATIRVPTTNQLKVTLLSIHRRDNSTGRWRIVTSRHGSAPSLVDAWG